MKPVTSERREQLDWAQSSPPSEPPILAHDQDGEPVYGCPSVHPADGMRCYLLLDHDEPKHEWCEYNSFGQSVGFVQW